MESSSIINVQSSVVGEPPPILAKRRRELFFLTFLIVILSQIGVVCCANSCDKSRVVITNTHGFIEDGEATSNYTQNTHCEWLIRTEGQYITLEFLLLSTECAYDYVFVHDGESVTAPLLGSFSGRTLPPLLLAQSGSMLVVLFSDTNYVLAGFRAEYSVTNCPHNCSDHGTCSNRSQRCDCDKLWGGIDCAVPLCPDNCGHASDRGSCNTTCQCRPGYGGDDCSLDENNFIGNTWHYLSRSGSGLFKGRTGHTSVYDPERDVLYIYGGYDLNRILDDLLMYDFQSNQWHEFDGTAFQPSNSVSSKPAKQRRQFVFFKNNETVSVRTSQEEEDDDSKNIIDDSKPRDKRAYAKPPPLYGHAMEMLPQGFVIFGGTLYGNKPSNELWHFNNNNTWTLKAQHSHFKPPGVSRHTFTLAGDYLYSFGGSLVYGKFSHAMYRIDAQNLSQWEAVEAKGGKIYDLRITGHSVVYHSDDDALVLYGGIVTDVARFSRLNSNMYRFDLNSFTWTKLNLPQRRRPHNPKSHLPPERAFHSAHIMGNYMIVFGGYSHEHNDVEACYDDKLYFYHLGCQTWVSERILEHSPHGRGYPKRQGIYGQASAVRKKNMLIISGGFHGSINSDVLAYTLPYALAMRRNDKVCTHYGSQVSCSSNPECGWCPSDGVCYLRTSTSSCASNLQTVSCPGICPSLTECLSCTLHGNNSRASGSKVVDQLRLRECSWCSHMQQCLPRFGTPDRCTKPPGGVWWSGVVKITRPKMCYVKDFTPGITLIKYYNPPDYSYPDEVAIVNETLASFHPVNPQGVLEFTGGRNGSPKVGRFHARFLGSIRVPNDPSRRNQRAEVLQVCVDYASMRLMASHALDQPLLTIRNSTWVQKLDRDKYPNCHDDLLWPDDGTPLALLPGSAFHIDMVAERNSTVPPSLPGKPSKLVMQRKGSHYTSIRPLTANYLAPYRSGGHSCSLQTNCMACTADTLCGWCSSEQKCLEREDNDACSGYLVMNSEQCVNCTLYIYCSDCVANNNGFGDCEWLSEEARCVRRGRFVEAVQDKDKCPTTCQARTNCSTCVGEPGRCVWCEETNECFLFSVYTSDYQYGRCRKWIDKEASSSGNHNSDVTGHCKSCDMRTNCSTCLQGLGCGWCYSQANPTIGSCINGDFSFPSNTSHCQSEDRKWAYAECPDIDECQLDLHDCHANATCKNLHGSFECNCDKGFVGDGKLHCERTCFEDCVYGHCSEGPDYRCLCDLGWTGSDCSLNCGCNQHSTCDKDGVGTCDLCQKFTTGSSCQVCVEGSYGNATDPKVGCTPCYCHHHEDLPSGICDQVSGHCFCTDHTEGPSCDQCQKGFYGDPRDGGHCYFDCTARAVIRKSRTGHLGSYNLRLMGDNSDSTPPRECLWIIESDPEAAALTSDHKKASTIQLSIEYKTNRSSRASCNGGTNRVYVYDGLPEFVSTEWGPRSRLLGAFCNTDLARNNPLEATSGLMSVYYVDDGSEGFNASFNILDCPYHCQDGNHACSDDGQQCECKRGWAGHNCSVEICPSNCGAGVCNTQLNLCECTPSYSGLGCADKADLQKSLTSTDLFRLDTLPEPLHHYKDILPRFGHSLGTDRQDTLWLFGGYSLTRGPLNDIRAFDVKNSSWIPITVRMQGALPAGRHFHASALVAADNMFYIQGGMNRTHYLDDFWRFDILHRAWQYLPVKGAYIHLQLAGHTMTYNGDEQSLVIIGGFSPKSGFSNTVLEYRPSLGSLRLWPTRGYTPLAGIYGHSTVYHSESKTFYVYGGISYRPEKGVDVTDKLYALNYPSRRWSLVPVVRRGHQQRPQPRALHTAVTTDNYMLLIGGLTDEWMWREELSLLAMYVYKCGLWLNLNSDQKMHPIEGLAAALNEDTNNVYIMGGFRGQVEGSLKRINLPRDYCQLFHAQPLLCKGTLGCAHCSVFDDRNGRNATFCYSNSLAKPATCTSFQSGTLEFSNGVRCEENQHHRHLCGDHKSCGDCLSSSTDPDNDQPDCVWCTGCNRGKCVARGSDCRQEHLCHLPQEEIGKADKCPDLICAASDCQKCQLHNRGNECVWTRQVQRLGEQMRTISLAPLYDWMCERRSALEHANHTFGSGNLTVSHQCPIPCHEYNDCKGCLQSQGAEGGWSECRWSLDLNMCLSPSYIPLRCAGGLCGRVLTGSPAQCPLTCHMYNECQTCLAHTKCGWCSRDSGHKSGMGICTEGTLEGGNCDNANYTVSQQKQQSAKSVPSVLLPSVQTSWHFQTCPPENECLNGHHTCDPVSEVCIDTLESFKCNCSEGYRRNNYSQKCQPVCTKGCVHGDCVEPERCRCHFSFVGDSCDVSCLCNGHAECKSADERDQCLECKNNTMGNQCEFCKPFYVGDPRDGGSCVSCNDYCHGHTDHCFEPSLVNSTTLLPVNEEQEQEKAAVSGKVWHLEPQMLHNLKSLVKVGTRDGEALCVNCQHMTAGHRCDRCVSGYFRGAKNKRQQCQPCDCNGHGNVCDEITGDNCQCHNNTVSDLEPCSRRKLGDDLCHLHQCSKCKEYYIGSPEGGHQCYRQMSVDTDYCFDPTTQSECNRKPKTLSGGQTVYFVVLPKFMNVDIRIVIDVTKGAADVLLSPESQMFIVDTNRSSWEHTVYLDPMFQMEGHFSNLLKFKHPRDPERPETVKISTASLVAHFSPDLFLRQRRTGRRNLLPQLAANATYQRKYKLVHKKVDPWTLNTFVQVSDPASVLHVENLQNRLVISLPEGHHDLRTTRFFLLIRSNSSSSSDEDLSNSSFGFLYFRQDQLHIDLFVFFSVFFSCFFLFLAACVVVWKLKSIADGRRARRRHAVEMRHMAQRPFARQHVCLSAQPDSRLLQPRGKFLEPYVPSGGARKRLGKFMHNAVRDSPTKVTSGHPDDLSQGEMSIVPVAMEPLSDSAAAVATVFVQMPQCAIMTSAPQGQQTLSFGCVLVQCSSYATRSLRRRSNTVSAPEA